MLDITSRTDCSSRSRTSQTVEYAPYPILLSTSYLPWYKSPTYTGWKPPGWYSLLPSSISSSTVEEGSAGLGLSCVDMAGLKTNHRSVEEDQCSAICVWNQNF